MKRPLMTDETKDLLWNHLIPNMRLLFMWMNPDEYRRWQGNCCRQAALMTVMALIKESKIPAEHLFIVDCKMEAWIKVNLGAFKSKTWDHAFVQYRIPNNEYYLAIDMSLKQQLPIWWHHKESIYHYPHRHNDFIRRDYKIHHNNLSLMNMANIPPKLSGPEYYTGASMDTIYETCRKTTPPTKETLDEIRQPFCRNNTRSVAG